MSSDEQTNTVFIVEERQEIYEGSKLHIDTCVIFVGSTFEKAKDFIRRSIEEENSGIDSNTLFQITEEVIDSYFGDIKTDWKTAAGWLRTNNFNGLTND